MFLGGTKDTHFSYFGGNVSLKKILDFPQLFPNGILNFESLCKGLEAGGHGPAGRLYFFPNGLVQPSPLENNCRQFNDP